MAEKLQYKGYLSKFLKWHIFENPSAKGDTTPGATFDSSPGKFAKPMSQFAKLMVRGPKLKCHTTNTDNT